MTPETADLVSRLKLPVPSDTPFLEVRFIRALRRPLQLRGELHYGGARILGKRVDTPYQETTTISDDQVEVVRSGKSPQRFSMSRAPELAGLLASFGALLSGDSDTLYRLNHIVLFQMKDDNDGWTIHLNPRSLELSKRISGFIVTGDHNEPRCFNTYEADGDSSIMLLGNLTKTTLPETPTRALLSSICRLIEP